MWAPRELTWSRRRVLIHIHCHIIITLHCPSKTAHGRVSTLLFKYIFSHLVMLLDSKRSFILIYKMSFLLLKCMNESMVFYLTAEEPTWVCVAHLSACVRSKSCIGFKVTAVSAGYVDFISSMHTSILHYLHDMCQPPLSVSFMC